MTSSDLDPSRAFRLATARSGRTVAFEDVRIRVLRRRRRGTGAAAAAVLAAAVALIGGLLLAPLPGGQGKVVPGSHPSAPRSAPTRPPCPNPEGGSCVGSLAPGRSYTTVVFSPSVTYSVPAPGWSNFEDTPGNFLLTPPGSDLDGVNGNTSDFISVDTSVTAATYYSLPSCDTNIVPGISTPGAMVSWVRQQPEFVVSRPKPVAVGGLKGQRIDVAIKPSKKPPTCRDGSELLSGYKLLVGVAPSSLDHGLILGLKVRLYLLAYHGGILAIELDDIPAAPGDLNSLSAVADRLIFDG